MKKLLLILLCLPLMNLAQQTYVPDNNLEWELINLGYDVVLDDSVLTANINTVTFLELNWLIMDATGLEDFVSLTTLQMWECGVWDLDLSQNINLTSLWLDSTSALQTLNLKNGNNLNMTINIWGAWNLQCINVDDVVWANNNWASVLSASPTAFFSEDCDKGRMEGYVYFDTDSSTTFDVSEAGLQNQVLELVDGNGVTQYVNTDNTGFFTSPVDSALSFTLSYYPLSNFYETSNNVSHTFQNIAYDSVLTALNFGVLSDTSYLDASISITKSFTLCNDTATIWIDVTNYGGTDIDGSFEVWVDNQTPIIAASGSPVITSNHIEWSFTGLPTGNSIQQTINVIIPATPGVILIDSARITPIIPTTLSEINTSNNFDEISNMIFCSWDPNDKKVQPEQCYYKSDEIMDYTIRFQNTGNYPAQKVRIIDTLDYNVLDVLSFQVVGASHDYTWQFKGSSVLEVIFDNIQLVDSSVSYVESQGFFKYQIQFKDNITALSKSEMSAYIYFDYNQPVITNKPLAVYSENFNAIITHSLSNLEVQIIDGASPFTYLWSTNDSTQNINIQSTGIHWAIITDANGCELDTLMYNVTGVAGCTDPLACNYDSLANIDDGSCILPDGCTDPLACNYDSTALCDDGSCILPDGCTDPLACNYDSTALCDDGSCILPDGCTDPLACNYDSTALCDDGSCILPDGCTDPLACNYDSTALCDDGSCILPDGCTDPLACNYDSTALCDDGSCILPDGCTDPLACNYDSTALCDDGSCILPDGCTDPLACNYDSTALCDDGSCVSLPDGCTDPLACNYDSTALCDDGSCILPDGCTDPLACNYDSTALCDDGSCVSLPDGCTDPLACNYDSTALCDDGSCILPDGCTDPLACNYDSTALCDDGSCILPDGCTDPLACNYDSTALCDDGSCVYPVIWQQAYNICDGDNVVVGSSVYDTTGVYTDTLNASNGCDSIVYTNLTVFQHTIDSITRNICDGESIVVGNSVYNTTGNYTDSLASIHGCDSIIYTNLVVNQHTSSYDTLSLNPFPLSATVVWNGLILNTSGDTSVVLTNSVGCDSVAHFNLTVTHPSTGILNINNTEKTLLKITDLLGRETKGKKNQPLFYIYNDGTVEKRIVVE